MITQAVFHVEEAELRRRNAARTHQVPDEVLAAQLRRYQPPYPGEAHRLWCIGADGKIADTDGELHGDGAQNGVAYGDGGGDGDAY